MRDIRHQTAILWLLTIFMLVNVALSAYIHIQKAALLRGESTDICFAGTGTEGNCADVQLSEYGKLLGVSVTVWGMILFSFMTLLIASLAYSLRHRRIITSEQDIIRTLKFAGICFAISAMGSAYFITLQFFVLGAICKYCMAIDSIALISAAIFFVTFKKGVDFYTS
jgi:uncharacterized membrane protein